MSAGGAFVACAALAVLPGASRSPEEIVVRRPAVAEDVLAWRASLGEGRPALRGFRAPFSSEVDLGPSEAEPGSAPETPPVELPDDPLLRRAAVLVAKRLAREGLLETTVAAIEALGVSQRELEGGTDRLRAVGLPVDWLESFALPGRAQGGAAAILREIAGALAAGETADSLREACRGATFAFQPSVEGFAVATESGEHEIGLVRLQLTSGSYWTGPGDGGSLDLARQLLDALPRADFVASVEEKHLRALLASARDWPIGRAGRLTAIPEPLPVAQWAQDNAKPGLAPAGGPERRPVREGEDLEVVWLAPRYASRGEDGAVFVPGETFLLDDLRAAGHRVARSPLLFQGGDLLAARDPRSGERLLLVGEANVWRNTALGLSREQVLDSFRVEFGVDRCHVVPAVSFHVDQEVSLRSVGDRLVALVADPATAARIVLACGLEALQSAGVLDATRSAEAGAHLAAGRDREFLALVVPETTRRCLGFGRFPESLAAHFSSGGADSGVGNLQRFLMAADWLTSASASVDDLPADSAPHPRLTLDPHSIAYLRALRRADGERRELAADLRRLGFAVEPIPSLPDAKRGIDYLNGIHERGRYLAPAWGGLYAPLDRAAQEALHGALGPSVEIVPILCSESQRRGGALHCSISAGPRP